MPQHESTIHNTTSSSQPPTMSYGNSLNPGPPPWENGGVEFRHLLTHRDRYFEDRKRNEPQVELFLLGFKKLPVEVRCLIWKYCFVRRIVAISVSSQRGADRGYIIRNLTPLPITLFINQESRDETLRPASGYRMFQAPSLSWKTTLSAPIYFNKDLDSLAVYFGDDDSGNGHTIDSFNSLTSGIIRTMSFLKFWMKAKSDVALPDGNEGRGARNLPIRSLILPRVTLEKRDLMWKRHALTRKPKWAEALAWCKDLEEVILVGDIEPNLLLEKKLDREFSRKLREAREAAEAEMALSANLKALMPTPAEFEARRVRENARRRRTRQHLVEDRENDMYEGWVTGRGGIEEAYSAALVRVLKQDPELKLPGGMVDNPETHVADWREIRKKCPEANFAKFIVSRFHTKLPVLRDDFKMGVELESYWDFDDD